MPPLDAIIAAVALEMGVPPGSFLVGRAKFNVACRRVLYLVLRRTPRSLADIGRDVGRDHTTVLHALQHASHGEKETAAAIWGRLVEDRNKAKRAETPTPHCRAPSGSGLTGGVELGFMPRSR